MTESRATAKSTPRQSLFSFLVPAADKAEERAFREHYLQDDIKLLATVVLGALAFMVGLTVNDFSYMTEYPGLQLGVQIRVGFILLGGALLFALLKYRRAVVIDLCAGVYSSALAIGILVFHLNSDPGTVRIALISTFFIFAISLAFPTYALYSLLPALILIVGDSYILLTLGEHDQDKLMVILTLCMAMVFSTLTSAHLQRSRFNAFDAMRQVKTLTGMIPICASCKKIRDDDGFYQQIETYISEHSNAEFSHDICPDCSADLYGEDVER